MLKKIILIATLAISTNVVADKYEWRNDIFAEKNTYNYSANITNDMENRFEYKCSVLKLNNQDFAKIDYINLDLNLDLENESLLFQERYTVNVIFSSGREYSTSLPIKVGLDNHDRFTFYLNSTESEFNSDMLISNLVDGDNVILEVLDSERKRMLYKFELEGSKVAINKSKNDCEMLFQTFK